MKFTIYEWQRHLPLRFTPRSSRREEAPANSRISHPTLFAVQSVQPLAEPKPFQHFDGSTVQRIPRSVSGSQRLLTSSPTRSASAFTLIELLVVIAIAAILAALLLTAGGIMVQKSNIQRAISERDQLETAIDAYHAKYGFYPPSSQATGSPLLNQLYYELIGTYTNFNSSGSPAFETLDESSEIDTNTIVNSFGVSAFMNCKRNGDADNSIPAQTFLPGLKAGEIASNGAVMFIVTAANSDLTYRPMPNVYSLAGRPANPWRYVCPGTNNPNSYDLWVQVFVGNKTNLICNWHKDPLINVQMP
ncbi:MAG TPA: prepilin-type N-terminal cleavage/methylation domain-containing protein [Verrucomicrobiae bacterium]|nr:prepilin-type N-terminal cleavage/methylation domain-containing protein [Verrucomicrobiae bacterium]